MAQRPQPQPGIDQIALYKGGASQIEGRSDVLKLSSNENPFGASDAAKQAFSRAMHDLHRYPSTDHAGLRAAIAEVWGLDAERIVCGVGSGELLKLIADGFAGPGDEVVYTEHGFSMYPIYAKACGATSVVVPEKDRRVDVEGVIAACGPKTRVVYVANPANPTGTFLTTGEIARLVEGVPAHAILVLDGAYAEYVDGYDGGAALVEQRENVVMTRTFSKIYGLGGLRIGWAYGSEVVVDTLNRLRGPFNLSAAALAAGEAAMRDRAHTDRCRTQNTKCRAWMTEALREIGVEVDPSEANFVLARFKDEAEAKGADAALREEGIIVRPVTGYGFPEGLRITVGDEAACRRVVHTLAGFKGAR